MRIAPVAALVAIAALVALGRGNAPLRAPGAGAPAQSDSAAVTRPDPVAPADTAAPAPALAGPVTVESRIVDARTAAGIAGAVVIVLEAGATSDDWTRARGEAATDALMHAAIVTGANGGFEINDLERGRSYTVMVTAEGYEPAVFEGGLRVRPDDPAVTRVDPVPLEPS